MGHWEPQPPLVTSGGQVPQPPLVTSGGQDWRPGELVEDSPPKEHLVAIEVTGTVSASGQYASYLNAFIFTICNKAAAKVMFLQVSVCPQRGLVSQHALQVVSQHALQQVSRGVLSQHALHVVSQHALQQVSRGCLLWGVMDTTQKQTATVADGTHPTGMHSCFKMLSKLVLIQYQDITRRKDSHWNTRCGVRLDWQHACEARSPNITRTVLMDWIVQCLFNTQGFVWNMAALDSFHPSYFEFNWKWLFNLEKSTSWCGDNTLK